MFSRKLTYKKIPLLLFLLAVVFFIMSLASNNQINNTEKIARKTEKHIERRIEVLDKHIEDVLESYQDENNLLHIPEDMVIYRYVNDSLDTWINQFPISIDRFYSNHCSATYLSIDWYLICQ